MLITYVLFPLPEPRFLRLDLLGELLPQLLLLLLELRIIRLLDLGLSEFARLHLCLPVVFVVQLLGRRDEIEHVCADKERAEFLEIAVALVFN